MIALFGLATATAAALIFWVEPLIGRLLLPLLGGAPSVWNTCMVFFQAMLLGGYALAHVIGRLRPRGRLAAHAAVLALPLAALPLALPAGAAERLAAGSPEGWLLATLTAVVGLPFLALATTTSLVQVWAISSGDPRLRDPAPLYALSNAGSFVGLVLYPLVLEPRLATGEQLVLWSRGYAAVAALVLAAAAAGYARGRAASAAVPGDPGSPSDVAPEPIDRWRIITWILLSAVPSSLLLGVTSHATSDIAAVPLLWMAPLALYLATFVSAFARRPPVSLARADSLLPGAIILLAATMLFHSTQLIWLPLHLATFTLIALVCHLRLAESRPDPRQLTAFFFWVSLGGVLGGFFNALVAPLAFDRVIEYHLVLAVACFLRPRPEPEHTWPLDLVFAVGITFCCACIDTYSIERGRTASDLPVRVAYAVPVVLTFLVRRRRTRFALAVAGLFVGVVLGNTGGDVVLHRERTFFGAHQVQLLPAQRVVKLVHGHINHGMQRLSPDLKHIVEPLTYYHRDGPAGDVFRALAARRPTARVGLVGLGAGSLASYARPGDEYTFHEIDPAVIRIAQDPGYFTFLSSCRGRIAVLRGDARLTVAAVPKGHYDLLVLDAFSSDSVPVHLLTREALALYFDRLAPDGVLALHISNMYLDLRPLLGALAGDLHLVGGVRDDLQVTFAQIVSGHAPSTWAAMSRGSKELGAIGQDPRWAPLLRDPAVPAWTDARASLLDVLAIK